MSFVYRVDTDSVDASASLPSAAITTPYRAADRNARNQNWVPLNYSANQAIQLSSPLMGQRSRDAQRNDEAYIAAEQALVDNVIAGGIGVTPSVVAGRMWDMAAEEEEQFNEEASAYFAMWADKEFCADFKWPFWFIQQQALREVASVGECFLVESFNSDPNRFSPLQYQLFEAEQLCDSIPVSTNGMMGLFDRGIEYQGNKPIAYWFYEEHPADLSYLTKPVRIPADRVIHFYCPQRARARRGAGYFNATQQNSSNREWLVGNVLTAAAIQAMFTLVHKTDRPQFGINNVLADTDIEGRPTVRLGRGIVSTIGQDDEVTPVQSSQPGPQLGDFIRLLMQLQSMGSRMSYLSLTRDFSATNYTSAKAAIEADKKTFVPLQKLFGCQIVKHIYSRFLDTTAGINRFESVRARTYWAGRMRYHACELTLPGFSQLDELKDASAAIARMGSLQSTLRDEYTRLGKPATYWRQAIRQRERELTAIREASERAGLPLLPASSTAFVGKDMADPTNSGRGTQSQQEDDASEEVLTDAED